MIEIYSLTYSQNGNNAADGPSIADFWNRANAESACPGDCVVTARTVSAEYTDANCED